MGFFNDLKQLAEEVTEKAAVKAVQLVERADELERETRDQRAALKVVAQEAFIKGIAKLDQFGNKIAELLDETPKQEAPVQTATAKKSKAKKPSNPKKKNQ